MDSLLRKSVCRITLNSSSSAFAFDFLRESISTNSCCSSGYSHSGRIYLIYALVSSQFVFKAAFQSPSNSQETSKVMWLCPLGFPRVLEHFWLLGPGDRNWDHFAELAVWFLHRQLFVIVRKSYITHSLRSKQKKTRRGKWLLKTTDCSVLI